MWSKGKKHPHSWGMGGRTSAHIDGLYTQIPSQYWIASSYRVRYEAAGLFVTSVSVDGSKGRSCIISTRPTSCDTQRLELKQGQVRPFSCLCQSQCENQWQWSFCWSKPMQAAIKAFTVYWTWMLKASHFWVLIWKQRRDIQLVASWLAHRLTP